MKHITQRILAALTSGAAAVSMVSAMPQPAGAEEFVHGRPRRVFGSGKLVENIQNDGEYYYYFKTDSGTLSCSVLEDHDFPRSCSTYAAFQLSLPNAWTVDTAAERLGQIVTERAGHSEYEYKDNDIIGNRKNTKTDFYFGIYDPNRDDDFYGIIADLYDYLPQLGFEINGLSYYAEYGIVNHYQPGAFGSYTDLDDETVSKVNSYLKTIDSGLSLSESGIVVKTDGEDRWHVDTYYPELAEKFGIWPGGARTCVFSPADPALWQNAEKNAQQLSDAAVSAAKDKYRVPDYCASFKLHLSDAVLKSLAEQLGADDPAEGQPLDSSLVAEALDTGFAAKILPVTEGWDATGCSGYSYTVQLNSGFAGQKDSAARLLAYIGQKAEIFSVTADSVKPGRSLSQIGDYKRIDGLHDYYAKKGSSLAPDKQYYYDAEKTGLLAEVTHVGNSGIAVTLPLNGKITADQQKTHIAALAAQYFGAGCQILSRPIYMAFDGIITNEPLLAAVTYEITLPKQSTALQADAEKLYRTLLEEDIAVDSCYFYPEFGWVNTAIPQGYAYNAAQFDEITAFLSRKEPDYYLSSQNQTTMQILSKSESNPRDVGAVYAEVFETLGYWPDEIVVTDGSMHGMGTDLSQTVKAEKRTCLWQSPMSEDERDRNFYANYQFFAESDGRNEASNRNEVYTAGSHRITFYTYEGYLAFRLTEEPYGDNGKLTFSELDDLIKKYLNTSYCETIGKCCYLVQFSADRVKAEDISAFRQALAGTGLLKTFYEPGNVASLSESSLAKNDALYYGYFEKSPEWVQDFLAEYYPDWTFESGVSADDLPHSRPEYRYYKITPASKLSADEMMQMAREMRRAAGTWPEMIDYLTNNPVYAVRESSTAAGTEPQNMPCEWLNAYIRNADFEPGWSDYIKFDDKGMFGNAETYILESEGNASLVVFNPMWNAIGCYAAAVNCSNETLVKHIRQIVSPYHVSMETSGLIIIQNTDIGKSIPQEDVQKIRNALNEQGLIRTFFEPGDIAYVDQLGPANKNTLYYTTDTMKDSSDVLKTMQNWLAANRPGFTADYQFDNALGRTDTTYIKVAADKTISDAELLTLAADLFEQTGEKPVFSVMLPNLPVYALRGGSSLYVRGDMNLDNHLDVSDAVMAARYIAEDRELTVSDEGLANADVQGDGKVNSDDLTLMLRAIAKQITL